MGNVHNSGQTGVTLVELLVVMVILSVALTIVTPSMTRSYDAWTLRSTGQRTVALFRFASDAARRDGKNIAGYYSNHRLVLLRDNSILKEVEIPPSITIQPEKPGGAVFLSSGQIVETQPFVLQNDRGRKITVEVGPLPGQVALKENTQ
jgi:prepilin-type N-terminal cleavage/methylation domain-containing protein